MEHTQEEQQQAMADCVKLCEASGVYITENNDLYPDSFLLCSESSCRSSFTQIFPYCAVNALQVLKEVLPQWDFAVSRGKRDGGLPEGKRNPYGKSEDYRAWHGWNVGFNSVNAGES